MLRSSNAKLDDTLVALADPTRRGILEQLSRGVRTLPLTAAIGARAAELPEGFPGDPVDRVIFATAVEQGLSLVTRDRRMRAHDPDGQIVIW